MPSGIARNKRRTDKRPDSHSAPARPRSLEARIQEQYQSLPPSELKIADLILDFPGEVAAYSATELAELAEASKAAVTRLITRLGYSNFEEARRAARDARRWGSPIYLLSKDSADAKFPARIKAHIDQDLEIITRTFEGLDGEVLRQITRALADAKRVWIFGYRNSHFLAGYFRWQLIQVRGEVHLLPIAGETLAEYVADMTPEDLFVVIGFRRRLPEVRRATRIAGESGIPVLFITDPTARGTPAKWAIRCEVQGSDLFDRYAAAMSLLHFLGVGVVDECGAKGRTRLHRIEMLHQDLHEFT
ncbi:MAG: MurR/RpiR family transcriptional regulator [Methyloligellaceae bacterium]